MKSVFVRKRGLKTLALTALLAAPGTLLASHFSGQDPDSSVIVSRGGLEWVWASPVAPDGSFGNSVLELHHGFTLPSLDDWLASFSGYADLYDAFSNDAGNICASAYFNSGYDHCDASNAAGGQVWDTPFSEGSNQAHFETFLVRGDNGDPDPDPVPVPATLPLLGIGLAALGLIRRKKKMD